MRSRTPSDGGASTTTSTGAPSVPAFMLLGRAAMRSDAKAYCDGFAARAGREVPARGDRGSAACGSIWSRLLLRRATRESPARPNVRSLVVHSRSRLSLGESAEFTRKQHSTDARLEYSDHARLSHKAVSEELLRDRGDGRQSGWGLTTSGRTHLARRMRWPISEPALRNDPAASLRVYATASSGSESDRPPPAADDHSAA